MHTVAAAGLAIAGRRGQPRDRGGMSGQRRCGLSAQQGASFSHYAERKEPDTGHICPVLRDVPKRQIHRQEVDEWLPGMG